MIANLLFFLWVFVQLNLGTKRLMDVSVESSVAKLSMVIVQYIYICICDMFKICIYIYIYDLYHYFEPTCAWVMFMLFACEV